MTITQFSTSSKITLCTNKINVQEGKLSLIDINNKKTIKLELKNLKLMFDYNDLKELTIELYKLNEMKS